MRKLLFFLFLLIVCVFGTAVYAKTEDTSPTSSLEIVIDDSSIEEIKKIPSAFGLWWRGVREYTSVWFTFDPVQKVKRQLQFAQERMRLAELMAESEDPQIQKHAEEMVGRAQKFMNKIEERKEHWIEKVDDKKTQVLDRFADFEKRRQEILDKVEERANRPVE